MKLKFIILLLVIFAIFNSCRNDDFNISNESLIAGSKNNVLVNRPESNFLFESLWEEDFKFILNTKIIFEKNIDQKKFENVYGVALWNYAMSMGRLDESFAVVPVLKNKKIKVLLQITRIDNKVYFTIDRNKQNIEFFQVFIDTDKKDIIKTKRESSSNRSSCYTAYYEYWSWDNNTGEGTITRVSYEMCEGPAPDIVESGGYNYGSGPGGGGSSSGGSSNSSDTSMSNTNTIRDQIVKDNPCMGPIYNQVTNDTNGIIKDFISKFRPTDSLTDVNVNLWTENSSSAGRTTLDFNNQIFIDFNTTFLGSDPTYLAKLIAHEYLHAHLFDELVRSGHLTRESAMQMNIFDMIQENNVYQSLRKDASGQHYVIADQYVDYLIDVMREFDVLNGTTHTDEQYKKFAWIGLDNTPQFEKSGLNSADWNKQIPIIINKKSCQE